VALHGDARTRAAFLKLALRQPARTRGRESGGLPGQKPGQVFQLAEILVALRLKLLVYDSVGLVQAFAARGFLPV